MPLSAHELALIDGWQRGFPLVSRPYDVLAQAIGVSEACVRETCGRLAARGVLSRIGAAVRPNTAGASTLAALSAPMDRIDEIAGLVSREPGVNHNYQREHALNLWFVVTGRDVAAVAQALQRIEQRTGCPVLDLRLERSYHIDLGFPIARKANDRGTRDAAPAPLTHVADEDRALLEALQNGLDFTPRPYATLGCTVSMSEDEVIARLRRLIEGSIIARFGLIVRHRALGYTANAMAVWDIPDGDVDRIGAELAKAPYVTLCYRRTRRPPRWPYNLFCMVHGRARDTVTGQIGDLAQTAGIARWPSTILFSSRCFVQRAASLSAA